MHKLPFRYQRTVPFVCALLLLALGLHFLWIPTLTRSVQHSMGNMLTLEATLLGLVASAAALYFWLQTHLISHPLRQLAEKARQLTGAQSDTKLPLEPYDAVEHLLRVFGALQEKSVRTEAALIDAQEQNARAIRQAERSSKLLVEAVSSIAQGFTIYDENDRLVHCNETYRRMYDGIRDVIIPGNTFEHIVRTGAMRGQYTDAVGREDEWVRARMAAHQKSDGEVLEQHLKDGTWLMIVEYRTPSGYIVGNRVDITELKRATEDARRRELYQRATLDNLPFMFWLKDTQGQFLAVNSRFAQVHGHADADSMVGLTDFDIFPKDLAENYHRDDLQVMSTQQHLSREEPLAGSAGQQWVEVFKKPVIADDGSLLGTVGFARDITKTRTIVKALAESEQRWALAMRGANDGVWDWDAKTGKIYFSDRWKSMLGYEPHEIGDDFDEWQSRVHPDEIIQTQANLNRHLEGKSAFFETELRMRCKDGSYKWILSRGQALFDASGKPDRVSGSHSDVSERRGAEARVRDRTEQLDAIFSLSPDGFVSFDQNRRVKYANPAFLQMTGLKEQELAGLSETDFSERLARECKPDARFSGVSALRADQKIRTHEPESSANADTKDWRQVIELSNAGERVLAVRLRLSEAETVSQILYCRDITHETEVDHMKSEFLSTAAHELRTPMASIYGFSELLLHREFSEAKRKEYLQIIHRQTGLMTTILDELLDLARIEARRGKDFNLITLELGALVSDVVSAYKTPDARPAPSLLAEGGPHWVSADQGKLMQAIRNILSNAYKYSPQGGSVDITLLSEGIGGHEQRVGICVRDGGIGMTPEQLARVFERFYRADASGKIPGTGLGMAIVKEIIELHGGRIDITSNYGVGTTITLWVPAVAAPME